MADMRDIVREGGKPSNAALQTPLAVQFADRALRATVRAMCRNIRVLYNFDPPTTPEEVKAASLQFVRKVSGLQKPSEADKAAFERAIQDVATATDTLLASLIARMPPRTREKEREKAQARWKSREARLAR
jgi:hypothetical protein